MDMSKRTETLQATLGATLPSVMGEPWEYLYWDGLWPWP